MNAAQVTITEMGEDLDGFLGVLNTVFPMFALTADELRQELSLQSVDSRRRWIARIDGVPVGAAACERQLWAPESPSAEVTIGVLERARRRGIGSQLLDLSAAFARDLGLRSARIFTSEDHPDGIQFLQARGYREVERLVFVELDLTRGHPVPADALPDGVRIVSLAERPDLRRAYHDTLVATVPDVPGDEGFQMLDWEKWNASADAGSRYRPASMFLVIDDDDRACAVAELEFLGLQPDSAWHGFTAVLREHRRRGIARALKRHTVLHARDELGLRRLITENEARNVGMRAINAEYGYEPVPAGLVYLGDVSSADSSA